MFEYPGPAVCDHVILHFVSCFKCFYTIEKLTDLLVWVHKTSFILPLFTEVTVLHHVFLWILTLSLSMIFLLDFGTGFFGASLYCLNKCSKRNNSNTKIENVDMLYFGVWGMSEEWLVLLQLLLHLYYYCLTLF